MKTADDGDKVDAVLHRMCVRCGIPLDWVVSIGDARSTGPVLFLRSGWLGRMSDQASLAIFEEVRSPSRLPTACLQLNLTRRISWTTVALAVYV